ncbi:hypothetical protein T02_6596 [Trichinella nativa]|uniref:Uncharacterized protein n=1 Tax=Trichinella nativa TaxID=6335 RepID=A0A0V1LH28_9BILA|nr:hypothetical protein T02_1133 [Trichinella nativa]KRZ58821.1 hypothetical protein T02_6596 [Trichinella nativa]
MKSQLILNYRARAWYLFESLAESTSMYSENYSEHLRYYGELKCTFTRDPDTFIAISGFGDFDFKLSSICGINGLKI